MKYVCRACGYHPDNRVTWCALGCGSDYNEMYKVPEPEVEVLKDSREFLKRNREGILAQLELAEAALKEIANANVKYCRDGHGFSHHIYDENGHFLGEAAPALQEKARKYFQLINRDFW